MRKRCTYDWVWQGLPVQARIYLKSLEVESILLDGLTLYVPTPQNGQTHSNNLSAFADALFECVWPFCGVGT